MIKVNIGETNFYKVATRKEAERRLELKRASVSSSKEERADDRSQPR